MKKYTFTYLPVGILLVLGMHFILYYAQLGAPSVAANDIEGRFVVKDAYAQKIEGNKLLIISGSSMFYNARAQMMEKKLGIPCVNYGISAGLSTSYILHRASELLNPGDIALIGLEYELFLSEAETSKVFADFVVSKDGDYVCSLPLREKVRLGLSFSTSDLISRNLKRFIGKNISSNENDINHWGDRVGNTAENRRTWHIQELDHQKPFSLNEGMSQVGWQEVSSFVEKMKEKDILVIATYPTLMEFPVYEAPEYQAFFNKVRDFYKQQNIPVLGSPSDFMYPKSCFYNTMYHALAPTSDESTAKLIELIKKESVLQNRNIN